LKKGNHHTFYKSIELKGTWRMPLETWVFVAIFALAGFLVIACGYQQELSLAFTVFGLLTISLTSLVLIKRFREWLEKI
jgi:hypothetical protein